MVGISFLYSGRYDVACTVAWVFDRAGESRAAGQWCGDVPSIGTRDCVVRLPPQVMLHAPYFNYHHTS